MRGDPTFFCAECTFGTCDNSAGDATAALITVGSIAIVGVLVCGVHGVKFCFTLASGDRVSRDGRGVYYLRSVEHCQCAAFHM